MALNDISDFELTWDLIKRNCGGAIRAFSAVNYPLSEPKPWLNSVTVEHLVHHTFRSGALCICRIWDENSRSIGDLVGALPANFLASNIKPDLLERMKFLSVFDDKNSLFEHMDSQSNWSSDDEAYGGIMRAISEEHRRTGQMPARKKLKNFRDKFLVHSTGVNVTDQNRSDFLEAKEFLIATLKLVDGLEWLLDNEGLFIARFDAAIDEALSDWEENKLINMI